MTEFSLQTPPPEGNRHDRLKEAVSTVNRIIMGKEQQVKLAFSCLLAGGHLLIEDLPGVGKNHPGTRTGRRHRCALPAYSVYQ